MKRKILLLGACLTLLNLTTGCNSSDKTFLTFSNNSYGSDSNNVYKSEKSYEEFESACENEYSFILVTYNDLTCSCFVNFKNISKEYFRVNSIDVYFLNNASLTDKNAYGYTAPSSLAFPTFSIVEDGRVKIQNNYKTDDKLFIDKATFSSYMDEKIMLPKIQKIDNEQLKKIKTLTDKYVIYYGNRNCGDCSLFYKSVLRDFIKKEYDKIGFNLVYIDRQDLNFATKEEWVTFKNENGLSNVNNTEFGYDVGYVPTLQIYENKKISQMIVYRNDTLDEQGMVTKSFYNQFRVDKLSFIKAADKAKYVLEGSKQNSEVLQKKHNELADMFLEYSL
ncbi:MAG: hypothetical protein RRZ92_02705 [Bacilli bacterium]